MMAGNCESDSLSVGLHINCYNFDLVMKELNFNLIPASLCCENVSEKIRSEVRSDSQTEALFLQTFGVFY